MDEKTEGALLARIAELEKKLGDYETRNVYRNLQELAKKLEKIAELGEDGIIVFDQDYRMEFANAMAGELTGYYRGSLLGMDFRSLLGPDDVGHLNELLAGVGADESKRLCTEMELLRADKTKLDVEICITISRDEAYGMKTYAYIHDITERKRFHSDLARSEQKYRSLFQRVRHGLFISSREGRFLDCNQALLDLTGYERKDDFLKIDIARDLYVNPEDRSTFQYLVEQHGYVKDFEVDYKTKLGEIFTILLTAHAQRDEKGRITGYEGLMIDISDRKRMERELKNTNEFMRNLIESSADGIFVTDMRGNILIFNKGAENILGYRAEEVVGKMNIRQIYQPGLAREIMAKLRGPDYGGPGQIKSYPLFHRGKDGEMIEGDLSAALIYDEQGREMASVGIFRDLRDRVRMERELQEAQQALLQSERLAAMGQLTSQIAHELNNPIYGIMNTLELLKSEIPPESKRRRILELALSETVRLSEMLKSMLSFSKPEEEVRRPINMNELVEGILLMMDKQFRENNIKVECLLDLSLPEIRASMNQMRQVMLNIIKNAKEGMPRGGSLTVKTKQREGKILISITDTGYGIPDHIKDKIFDAFFTTKQKVKGVGLGLSVCYGIIRDHGGEIKVESVEGEGATFTVVLPI